MDVIDKNLCVIPARGGSTRIPRKNIKLFYGKPIIAYSIEAALKTGLFNTVLVSTDDEEIGGIAQKYGADVLFRPSHLAENSVGTFEVVRHALKVYGNEHYAYVCCIYATSPMISVDDIATGYRYINVSANDIDHVISVGYPPLQDAAQFYWSYSQAIWDDDGYFSKKSVTQTILIDRRRVCDINTPWDWAQAERMYRELNRDRE